MGYNCRQKSDSKSLLQGDDALGGIKFLLQQSLHLFPKGLKEV